MTNATQPDPSRRLGRLFTELTELAHESLVLVPLVEPVARPGVAAALHEAEQVVWDGIADTATEPGGAR